VGRITLSSATIFIFASFVILLLREWGEKHPRRRSTVLLLSRPHHPVKSLLSKRCAELFTELCRLKGELCRYCAEGYFVVAL